MISTFCFASNFWIRGLMALISPTLTAWIQIRVVFGFLGGRGGIKPSR